jgi:chemotaxis protein MotA
MRIDISTFIGLVMGVVFLGLGILFSGGSLLMFYDLPSIMITVGGSICAMMVAHPINRLLKLWDCAKKTFAIPAYNPGELIITLVSFSEKARREGLLALEDDLEELDDEFLRKGIQLVVDGTDPELVRRIMETEVDQMMGRHDNNKRMFDDWAGLAPAFGMIGTLQGLVMMLVNLNDKSMVGPYLAVAIITTFYGAVMSYLVFTPMGTKLDMQTGQEALLKAIMLEGVLSIQSGDNPRIVKDKLVSFLPPSEREAISQEVGE